MKTSRLKTFLKKAMSVYASGNERKFIKEKDKSISIVYKSGDFKMHDNFFGGEPYGGREMVFYKNKPHWIMVYYGEVKDRTNPKEIYPFLQKALSKMPKAYPFRGPKSLKQDAFVYKNFWKGDAENFSGEEAIYKGKALVYWAKYMGGLVNRKK